MCGIAGVLRREGETREEDLQRMADALQHRGPDDHGIYRDGPLGLVHTRLSIIDLAGGHQPIFGADGDLALIANGEIYNYIELREELVSRGCSFATGSDSETILQAYAAFGDDFIRHLDGMYAFALYDRARRRLILARDRLGIKPFYYAALPDRIVFGSEIKAILPLLPRTPEINPRALLQFMQNQFSTGEETIFDGVMRLPPGEMVVIDADLAQRRTRYWSALEVEPRRCTFEQARDEFDDLLEVVMRQHMRSDVPYGVFLSGGVDSAVVLAMLSRFQDKPVRSFSVGFANANTRDELPDAERIAKMFNAQHTALLLDRDQIYSRIPHSVWAADDLMRDYASLPTSILAEHASRELKVVLTGEGGDEVFAGYGRYRKTRLQRWLQNLVYPGSGGFRTRGQLKKSSCRTLFGPALVQAAAAQREPFINAWRATPKVWSDLQRGQYTDLVTALPDDLLVKLDRMLMAFGMEGRVPFLDHRIVEFGLSLPDELKVMRRQGKVFLKRWAERFLPADHLYQRKRGFYVPVGEWLTHDFLDQLGQKLPNNPAIRAWFRPDGVREVLARHRAGHNLNREIWCLMQFAMWHRLFVESPGSRPAPNENPLDWIG